MAILQYDEFEDTVTAGFWVKSDTGGASSAESGGKYRQTIQTGQQSIVQQQVVTITPIDVYTLVTMPEGSYSGGSSDAQFVMEDWNYGGDGDLGIILNRDAPGSAWRVWAYQDSAGGGNYDDSFPGVSIGQNSVYLRIKVGAGRTQVFYSLTEPNNNGDWTEITFTIPVDWIPTGNFDIGLYSNPDAQAINKTYTWDFFRKWHSSDGVGVDARLFKQQSTPEEFTSVTGKTFETDMEKVITSKGF